MKFEIGKTYYGINPGVDASWREFTVLAVIGEKPERQAAVKYIDRHGTHLATWVEMDAAGRMLFSGFHDRYYQETPPKPDFKVGDRITLPLQSERASHYILREEWTNARPALGSDKTQWVALYIHKDGTTRLTILSGASVENSTPYRK
jgi:hypothetical protein